MKLHYAVLGALLLAGGQAMACYTVTDPNGRILYQGMDAPVDMSLQLQEALAQRFPRGAEMVFDQNSACAPITVAQAQRPGMGDAPPNTIVLERSAAARRSTPSPLLTDRASAERANLPYTQVAGNVVVVPPAAADRVMSASVTVLPSTSFAQAPAGPDTTLLGAGPSPSSRAGNARAAAARAGTGSGKPTVVITELRDPRVTIIEGGGGVTINRD